MKYLYIQAQWEASHLSCHYRLFFVAPKLSATIAYFRPYRTPGSLYAAAFYITGVSMYYSGLGRTWLPRDAGFNDWTEKRILYSTGMVATRWL